MSDDPQTQESGQEQQASEELPVPKLEDASADSRPSGQLDTDALVQTILERLNPEIDKRVQSVKDKRIAEIEKRLDSGQFTELEALGASIPDDVKREYRLRELEDRLKQPQRQETSKGNGASLSAQDVSQVISDLSLDANDPAVIEALRGTYRNRDHFEATMGRMALQKVNRKQPSPSAAPSGNSGTAAAGVDEDALLGELQTLYKEPSKHMPRILEIQKALGK
jgi:hypothetical protein